MHFLQGPHFNGSEVSCSGQSDALGLSQRESASQSP